MDLPHSAWTGPSAPGSANFNYDYRLIAPFYSKVRKPRSITAHPNLAERPGLRRENYPGNPVLVGHIHFAGFTDCQRPFCVTGDMDDDDNVTLTIQSKDQLGFAMSDNGVILQEAMKKAVQMGITNILEVNPTMWMLAMKWGTDIQLFETFDKRFDEDPSWVRDNWPNLFMSTITNYVVRTIKKEREDERKHFLAMMSNVPEIYKECGYTDLAKLEWVEWSKKFGECVEHIMGVEITGLSSRSVGVWSM